MSSSPRPLRTGSTLRVTPTSALTHSFDVEERIRAATPADTLKGMFFQRIIEIGKHAGASMEHITRGRRYQPFFDYPVADYFRLVHAAASALYPRVVVSEAIRRVGRDDFARFAESGVGRVMLAFGGSARGALSRSGSMYGAVLKGSAEITSQAVPEGVRIRYRNYPGLTEVYPIGTIEGCCTYYGTDYEIEIDVLSHKDADYLVRLKE